MGEELLDDRDDLFGSEDHRHTEALFNQQWRGSASDHDRGGLVERADCLDLADQSRHVQRHRHRQPEHRRIMCPTRFEQAHQRDVGAEVQHIEPSSFEHITNHPQPKHVVLTLRCSQNHSLARPRLDAQDPWVKAAEHVLADRRSEMLDSDAYPVFLPSSPIRCIAGAITRE